MTKHYRKFYIAGWLIMVLLIATLLFFWRILPEKSLDLLYGIGLGLLIVSALLISFGDTWKLRSHRRRIRGVEIFDKAVSLPVIMIYLLAILSGEDIDIAKELVALVIFMIIVTNLTRIYDMLMMNRRIVTCAEMKDLERQADESGLSYLEMMERAGIEAFGYICEEELDTLGSLIIFCGKGNNGGDGFVVARKAIEYGCDVTIVLPCGLPTTPDAITNIEILCGDVTDHRSLIEHHPNTADSHDPDGSGGPADSPDPDGSSGSADSHDTDIDAQAIRSGYSELIPKQEYREDLRIIMMDDGTDLTEVIDSRDKIIVDAIFGTGFHGEPKGTPRKAIQYINTFKGLNMIYSLDVPSGLPGDETEDREFYNAVYADYVITFHARKPVHINKHQYVAEHMRKVIVADIGITKALDKSLDH